MYTVCAVGGCHLSGYIVGQESSLIDVAFRMKGLPVIVTASKPTSVKNGLKTLTSMLAEGDYDYIFLQLGNYESGTALRPGRNSLSERYELRTGSEIPTPNTHASILRPLAAAFIKLPMYAAQTTAYLFLNNNRMRNILQTFEAIVQYTIESSARDKIIVVGPTPDINPHVFLDRWILSRKMKSVCNKFGVVYIDAFQAVRPFFRFSYLFSGHPFMADSDHLNKAGHALLALSISQRLPQS